ncbi:MAG: murein L,D-transpeptidase catalytic domain family protein, partial [Chitinophagales bacterium]|nr:murein L,D-transpeptidase catalytic domain family protein [Chitinophagales bacterium]
MCKKHVLISLFLANVIVAFAAERPKPGKLAEAAMAYELMQLGKIGLSRQVFEKALQGYFKLLEMGKVQIPVMAICDFSKPSTEKRLYVIDLSVRKVLFNTWVAHGRNSG